jgi:outer membrane protein assembly factor BamB
MSPLAFPPVVLVMLALTSTSFSGTSPDISPTWTFTSADTIRWYTATPPGVLIVGTDQGIVGVAADSGRTIWRLEGLEDAQAGDFRIFGPTSLALVSLRGGTPTKQPKVFLMDIRDGRTIWSADSVGITECLGGFLLPRSRRFLMGAGLASEGKQRALVLLDLGTGAVLWKSEEFFAKYRPALFQVDGRPTIAPHQPPLLDSDSTLIVFMNKYKMRKYDLHSGAVFWEARVDSVRGLWDPLFEKRDSPALYHGFARMTLAADRQCFFAPFQNSIGCYSLIDGHGLWQKTPRLPGPVTQIEEVPAGLLVSVVDENEPPQRHLVLLEASTGQIRWKSPHGLVKSCWLSTSNFLVEEHRAIVAADGKLLAVSLESGKESAIADLGFKGEDGPRRLEARKDGFLVSGAQNLVLAARDGRPIFRFYRHAPGGSRLRAALLAVGSITAIAASELGEREWVSREDYGKLFLAVGEAAAEHGAAIDAGDVLWVLADKTGASDKPGLVCVNRADGEVIGEVPLGVDRPDFLTDWTGRVYVKSDGQTIQCFQPGRK